MMAKLRRKDFLVFLSLIVIFAIIFLPLWHGAGNNWDWLTPYFSSQSSNILLRQLSAWHPSGLGQPMSYLPGLLSNLIDFIILSTKIAPEYYTYMFLVALFGAGSFTTYYYWKDKSWYLAIVLALITYLNPAIFYKLLAGHLLYLVGYTFFTILFNFLLCRYRADKRSAVIVGLLIALSGIQVQFLVFSSLAVLVFLVTNPASRWRWPQLATIALIPVLFHSYWLIQFFTGGINLSGVSSITGVNTFVALGHAGLREIANLSFSSATFIRSFYTKPTLWMLAFFWLFPLGALIVNRKVSKRQLFIGSLLIVFVILSNGYYQSLPIPIVQLFYPMLREAGHAAPVLIFLLGALTVDLMRTSSLKWIFVGYAAVFVAISASIYFLYVPRVNFAAVRTQFEPFLSPISTINGSSRVLTYPFFGQYSIAGQPTLYRNGSPVSNSGWDSFTTFSGQDYIENTVAPQDFKQSLQYRFLQSYDVDLLSKYNIRYIFDYSSILSSNYANFVPASTYDDNSALIANDPNFLKKVISRNADKVRQISADVVEVTNAKPRVDSSSNLTFTRLTDSEYKVTLKNPSSPVNLSLLSNFNNGWSIFAADQPATSCQITHAYQNEINECITNKGIVAGNELSYLFRKPLFDASHLKDSSGFNSWTVDPSLVTRDANGDVNLVIFYRPQSWLIVGLVISILTLITSIVYLATYSRNRS